MIGPPPSSPLFPPPPLSRSLSLSAPVRAARHIAVGPQGVATFVGTRKSKVWVVADRARGGVGDEVKEFAPTLPKKIPNGGPGFEQGVPFQPRDITVEGQKRFLLIS